MITHKTDRIAPLNRGKLAGELLTKQTSQSEIASMIMFGKPPT